ncbi:MAG: hypothetical protein M5U13_02850 [Thermoanaerobaculia bacterium]|nr:hypothetical protein [Thermoanaerobaculia bacterium]
MVAARIGRLRAATLSGAVAENSVGAMRIEQRAKSSANGTWAAGSSSSALAGSGPPSWRQAPAGRSPLFVRTLR